MIQILDNPKFKEYMSVKDMILDETFPWNWKSETLDDANDFGFHYHGFLVRPNKQFYYPQATSQRTKYVHDAIVEILNFNQIDFQFIWRICANSVNPTETGSYSRPHVDHPWPHKNLLIHLNDPNGGETIVDGELNIGEEDQAIVFEGMHFHAPPTRDRRVVIVATFS